LALGGEVTVKVWLTPIFCFMQPVNIMFFDDDKEKSRGGKNPRVGKA